MAPFYYPEDYYLIVTALTSSIPSFLFSVAAYVLTALSLYTIARRREISKPWLAWVPVANVWILGSLSDQYQYLVHGQNKSKRKVLLALNILTLVLSMAVIVLACVMVAGAIMGGREEEVFAGIMGPAISMLGLCVPLIGVAIATVIVRYMAMYDVYRSTDPSNSVLFLVLSILVNVTEPFFLLFSRNKDLGMPPRRQPQQDPWTPYQDPNRDPWAPN